jgi:uncharacterized protein
MIRITVRVRPGSKRASLRKISDTEYEIAVTAQPERGRATDAARRALADVLHIAPSRVSLVMGAASRTKVFDIR